MNKDEFKRRFTAGWKMERCIDFDQALEGLLADARHEQKLADELKDAKLRYEDAEAVLEEYVGIVDAVTEALGPVTRSDREGQLDCDATVPIRVRNLRATADHLQAVLDRVRTLVSDTPTKYGEHALDLATEIRSIIR